MDTGAYVLNFKGCTACGQRDFPKSVDVETTEQSDHESGADEIEEEVTFKHQCKHCEHVIAEHYYSFAVEDSRQNFIM